jgi:hypothetical protein
MAPSAARAAAVDRSPRLVLARLAHEAVLSVRGVLGTDAGATGARATFAGRERVPGVVCTAAAGGVYELELHLVAKPVPLHPLAERVRTRVEKQAAQSGLGDLLGPINIVVEDVREQADRGVN